MAFILTAITLGLFSSMHCVGMCGPIALVLPVQFPTFLSRIRSTLFYNVGRTFAYALMGLLFGFIGKGFSMAGWQNVLSVVTGVLMLSLVLFPRMFSQISKPGIFYRPVTKIKQNILQLFRKTSPFSLFSIGVLNGFLPCGMVYLAIAGSLLTGSALKGMLFMVVFGLGTWPAMVSVSLIGQYIGNKTRNTFRKLSPYFMGVVALLLVLRGLNLDIPYLSPKTNNVEGINAHACCHK